VYAQVAYVFESGRLQFAAWAVDANGLTPAGYYSLARNAGPLHRAVIDCRVEVDYLGLRASTDLPTAPATGRDQRRLDGWSRLSERSAASVPALRLRAIRGDGGELAIAVLTGQTTLDALKWPAVVFVAITLLIFFLPLAVFTPALVREEAGEHPPLRYDATPGVAAVP
jgi:hypothetical protein